MKTINAYLNGEPKALNAFQPKTITYPIPTQAIVGASCKLNDLELKILLYLSIIAITAIEVYLDIIPVGVGLY